MFFGGKVNADLRILYEFDLAWVGWECDNRGWVAEDDKGKRFVILTNHGSHYIANEPELAKKIVEYRKLLEDTRKAIRILKGQDDV